MNHLSSRVKTLQIRLAIAKGIIAEVREFLVNPEVGNALLRHPESSLRKVEDYLSADCPEENEEAACYAIEQTLSRAETEISQVQKMGKQHPAQVGN